MDKLEHSIKVLSKVLNSELFLGKYPMINSVSVTKHNQGIDVVMFIGDGKQYWPVRDETHNYIWTIKKMLGLPSDIKIYTYP